MSGKLSAAHNISQTYDEVFRAPAAIREAALHLPLYAMNFSLHYDVP